MLACITVSLVSHGHGAMVAALVAQLRRQPVVARIVLTLNIPESLTLAEGGGAGASTDPDDKLLIVRNGAPKGFGANHNAAFAYCQTPYFCVLNPDVSIDDAALAALVTALRHSGAGLVAPGVYTPAGTAEDSVRHFPTLAGLVRKALGRGDGCYAQSAAHAPFEPDWVAGMCMLFDRSVYAALGGFDEGFFLYYEDVDICARAWRSGARILACPAIHVVHDARRASRRQWRYMLWHARSMLRYFVKHGARQPRHD